METQVMFLDCPQYLDGQGTKRCGLPAEVEYRYNAGSTGGWLESAKIRCPLGHWFNGPIEFLTLGPGSISRHSADSADSADVARR
jgi:hypothetical protein